MKAISIYQCTLAAIYPEEYPHLADHCCILLTDDDGTVVGTRDTLTVADAYESIRRHGQTWREARAWYGNPDALPGGREKKRVYLHHNVQPIYIAACPDTPTPGWRI